MSQWSVQCSFSQVGEIPKHIVCWIFLAINFKDFVEAIKNFHPYQVCIKKKCSHPSPLHSIITIFPFTKWGVNFITCHPYFVNNHKYIIMVVNYFTKWVKFIPTFENDNNIVVLFIHNHILARLVCLEIDCHISWLSF